jgi:hypothetical protein
MSLGLARGRPTNPARDTRRPHRLIRIHAPDQRARSRIDGT